MTFHLTPALEERLGHVAAQTHRSPDELAQEGVEAILDYEERKVQVIERGRADFCCGSGSQSRRGCGTLCACDFSKMKILWAKGAVEDPQEAFSFLERSSPEAAARLG